MQAGRLPPPPGTFLFLCGSSCLAKTNAFDANTARSIAGWGTYGSASRTLAAITARPLPDDLREREIDAMMRAGKAAWNAWLEGGSREDISARMCRLAVPVTFVSGTCDPVVPTPLQRRLAATLPCARLVVIPGAGHLLPVEAPDAVAAAIQEAAALRDDLVEILPSRALSRAFH